ncbi:MAG: hypothetical protein M3321_13120 [Actinomycetota bacterium]|nr:hypothetical protein [Actinomycetota bacterium]
MLDLELVDASRAAGRAQVAEPGRRLRVRDVPEHQSALGVLVVSRAGAGLDAGNGDVPPRERAVRRRVDHHVLRGAPLGVEERRDARRVRGLARVDHGDAAEVALRAEPRVAGRPVGEAPLADVRVLLVHPDVGVEAAGLQVVLADGDHVPRGARLASACVLLLRLLAEVVLVLQRAVAVVAVRERSGADGERRGGDAERDPCATHLSPLEWCARHDCPPYTAAVQ